MSDSTDILSAIACGDTAVYEFLADTSLNTLEQSGLDPLVRIAALVAMDAAPVSYAITAEDAMEAVEPDDIRSVLVALAPVVGSARIAAASSNVLDAYFDEADDDEVENDSSERVAFQILDEVPEYDMAEDATEELADDQRELEAV
jgi:4-carboxymuconolactone decarboxylase